MIDRLPPQSLEAEQSVLGSILIDPEAILKVADFLHPPDFYRQANTRTSTRRCSSCTGSASRSTS